MSQFIMPSLGADMEDGTLVEQLIAPGDPVHRGDIIAAVETQKGAIEIEVFQDGVLGEWLVPLGTRVPVGTPIATIQASDAPDLPDIPQPQDPATPPTPPEDPQPAKPDLPPPLPPDPGPPPEQPPSLPDEIAAGPRQRVTPAARRRAAEIGLDLATLGTDQIIALDDLPTARPPEGGEPMSAMRQAISAAMTRSKREIPHYYLADTLDLTTAEAFVAAQNTNRAPDARLLIGALFIRALARAAQSFPEFSGAFARDHFTPSAKVHVGMAIKLRGGGLVAPALMDTNDGDLDALMGRLRDLVGRVRKGRFTARELSDPTITLTSLGDRGVNQITGVIFPPQVAIVGIGTPSLRATVIDGVVTPRRIADITLAADHRVSDGHRGALFLRAIADHLQHPETL